MTNLVSPPRNNKFFELRRMAFFRKLLKVCKLTIHKMQMEVSKCLDDKVDLELQNWLVETKDKKAYFCDLEYCPKCNSYLTSKGMEKDLKKSALDFLTGFWSSKSYKLSDIINIKRM